MKYTANSDQQSQRHVSVRISRIFLCMIFMVASADNKVMNSC